MYDDDGNATSYPLPKSFGLNATLQWDAENRLTKITHPDGTVTTYQYDYLSRRINKTSDGTITSYLYDGWSCIAEYEKLPTENFLHLG